MNKKKTKKNYILQMRNDKLNYQQAVQQILKKK